MNVLDMQTVFSSYVISSAISMAVMASLWSQNRRRSPELAFWLADFIMEFTGLLLSLLRGSLPDFFSMLISNILIIGGTLLLLIGLERYTGKTRPQWHNTLFMGGVYSRTSLFCLYSAQPDGAQHQWFIGDSFLLRAVRLVVTASSGFWHPVKYATGCSDFQRILPGGAASDFHIAGCAAE